MIKLSNKYILFLFLLIYQNFLTVAQEKWELKKSSDGIEIFTKKIDNSNFKAFKANMKIDNSVHEFVALLKDVESLTKWAYKTILTSLLDKSGDTIQKYYSIARAPFPYKDRDGIYINIFKWYPNTNTLFVEIKIVDEDVNSKGKFVRLKGKGYWKVIVLPSNKIDITFQMQIDPGGNVPAWMANIFVEDSPFFTMTKLREEIKNKKYQGKKYDFMD